MSGIYEQMGAADAYLDRLRELPVEMRQAIAEEVYPEGAEARHGAAARILVCGSREWTDRAAIHRRLDEMEAEFGAFVLIVGGSDDDPRVRGADRFAAEWARNRQERIVVRPAWKRGRRAGFQRNSTMIALAPDRVLAFQLDDSPGTQDTIDKARRAGIYVEVDARRTVAP